MKSCRTCPWLCCCIALFCKLQQNTLLEPCSQRACVSHGPLELLARRTTGLKAMRAWLEEIKFYMFAINWWTNHPFKYCVSGVLMLLHRICRCRAVPCSFTIAMPGLKAGLNPAQPFDGVLICCSCLWRESKRCFQKGSWGYVDCIYFRPVPCICSQFPTCFS